MQQKLLIENKINYTYLQEVATYLPKPFTQEEFLQIFRNKNYANIQTPIKELEIQPKQAFFHLWNNSNNENRIDISGTILFTLYNPLLIAKDKKGSFYFYKPFQDTKGILNIISIAIPKSNRIQYKTTYIATRETMLKMIYRYEFVYKAV